MTPKEIKRILRVSIPQLVLCITVMMMGFFVLGVPSEIGYFRGISGCLLIMWSATLVNKITWKDR